METQGSVGAQDALSDDEIAAADLVLIAADREVDLSRFAGKTPVQKRHQAAINDGQNLIRKALARLVCRPARWLQVAPPRRPGSPAPTCT